MMKKHFTIIILLVVLMLVMSGCGTKASDITGTTYMHQEDVSTAEETSTIDNIPKVSPEETSGVTETTMPNTTIGQTTTSDVSTEPTTKSEHETTTIPTSTVPVETAPETTIPETEAPALNSLKIIGKVNFEMTITLDELKSLDDIIVDEDYYSFNSFGTNGHTHFKGVNLWYLLDQYAGIDDTASSITILATDGYKMTFTKEQIMRQDYIDETDPAKQLPVIIAWEENGTEYDPEDGAPYKLVIGQIAPGDVNKPQWVSMIDRIIVE